MANIKVTGNTATISGCKALIKLNGITLAHIQDVSYHVVIDIYDLETIDEPEVQEFCVTGVKVSGSLSAFRIYKKSAVKLGFMPKLSAILDSPELVLEIKDKINDNIIAYISGIKFNELSGQLGARGVWVESYSFKAKTYKDESEFAFNNFL